MAMYGWLLSSPGFDSEIDPAAIAQLQVFSDKSGKGPFKFVIGDVIDTPNGEGSMDHTVWIEIFDKDTDAKKGEISTELSDNEDQFPSSMDVLLAVCLHKLGFLDESENSNEPPEDAFEDMEASDEDLPLPDEEPKIAAKRLKAAASLLEAIKNTGISVNASLLPKTAMISDSMKVLDCFIRGTQ